MSSYTAFLLCDQTREDLLKHFPPRFSRTSADHITYEFNVQSFGSIFQPKEVLITGYVCDDNGLEALMVEIDGQTTNVMGLPYHITLSYDPERYKPFDSNALIEKARTEQHPVTPIQPPLQIKVTPTLNLEEDHGEKTKIPMISFNMKL